MNTTTKNRTRRLVAASILALAATVGTSTAHAAEPHVRDRASACARMPMWSVRAGGIR